MLDMKSAYAIALASKLKYVYLGNINNQNTTKCYNCGEELIFRNNLGFSHYRNDKMKSLKEKCFNCGEKIAGVF